MTRITSRRRKLAIGSISAALLLSGCTLGQTSVPELADVQLSPVGDNGQWFHDEYRNGLGSSYTTENNVCGIANGLIIEDNRKESPLSTTIQAHRLIDGELAWERDAAHCALDSDMRDNILVREFIDRIVSWHLVDLETGEIEYTLDLGNEVQSVSRAFSTPSTEVLVTDQSTMLGVASGVVEWELAIDGSSTYFPLDNGYLGIQNGLEGWIIIIDADTGEEILERTEVDTHGLTWASDGYILKINESAPEYAFFDVLGDEVDRTTGESQFGFFPRPASGITFPLDDHLRAGTVVAVDASGAPAILTQPSGHTLFTREARVNDSEFGYFIPSGLSRDGSLVLFSNDEGFTIANLQGEVVFDVESSLTSNRHSVQGGFIVLTDGTTTEVHLPAEA